MAITLADLLSGRATLPEPFQSQWRAAIANDDSVAANAAIFQGLSAMASAERGREAAVVAEEQFKAQLKPLQQAAAELREEKHRRWAPPTILSNIAAWVAIGVAAVTVYKLYKAWRKRKKAAA